MAIGQKHFELRTIYGANSIIQSTNYSKLSVDDEVIRTAMQKLYDIFVETHGRASLPELLQQPEFLNLINAYTTQLNLGVDQGITFSKTDAPAELVNKLKNDVFVFSGFKTYNQLKDATALLLDSTNNIKSFSDFYRDVRKLNKAYNEYYLQAEYNFAVASAQTASKWHDFSQDADKYNLQFRTAKDERVRASHAVLHGTTLPFDNAFWRKYIPPLDWNCRCNVIQVIKDKYEVDNTATAIQQGEEATTRLNNKGENMAAMFRFNPGYDQVIFPPNHPYYKVQQQVKDAINNLS